MKTQEFNNRVRLNNNFRGNEMLEWWCVKENTKYCKHVMEITSMWAAIRRTEGDEAVLANKQAWCDRIAEATEQPFTIKDMDWLLPGWLQREGEFHLSWANFTTEKNIEAYEKGEETPYKSVTIFGHANEKLMDHLLEIEEDKERLKEEWETLSDEEKEARRQAAKAMEGWVTGNWDD